MNLSTSLLRTASFAGIYVIATYAGRLTVMDDTNLSLVWPAAGVSAVWFLAQYSSRWRWLDALALTVVTLVVNAVTGAPLALAWFFVAANLAQAIVFAHLFRRWLSHLWGGGGDRPLARLRELWRLIAAAFLSTACGALIGPTGVWLVNGVYSVPATAVWLTRNTVSILLIGAAGIRLGQLLYARSTSLTGSPATRLRNGWAATPYRRRAEYFVVVALSAVVYLFAFGIDHGLPLAFPLLVMTVWAGLRLHTGFVILHDTVFGSTAVLFTLHGVGPFADIESNPVRALIAQLFVGMVAVVGLALALGRDERAALVDRLSTSEQHTAEQARLMKAIVDSMAEGLTVVDADGRFLLRNPAVRRLLGGVVSTSDKHADPGFYGLFHPDGTPLEREEMPHHRALAGEDVHSMDLLVRNPGVPEGRVMRVSSVALPGELEGTRYAVTVFHDVTAERRHRDELASFAEVVAHDLLNPLATVEGWSEALAESFADDPQHPVVAQAANDLVRIRRAAARMRNLITDLLLYATARDAALAPVAVDLGEVIGDIVAARTDQALSGDIPVPVFDVAGVCAVRADPVLVRQLLDNLISNAIKYTGPGGTPHISIAAEETGGVVTVTVTDNGIGIPEGQHHSIFDNFHRAHRTGGYSGTGLGLGICKRIVERHGGAITAVDNPAGGSRFTFTLPSEDHSAEHPTPEPGAASGQGQLPDRQGPEAAAEPAGVRPEAEPARPPASHQLTASLSALSPSDGFDYAARLVLEYLHDQMPLAFWAVTRVEDGIQTYLHLDADNGYGLRQGGGHSWEDSFCIHMAAGDAPAVALDAQSVPLYAAAGVNSSLTIGTYAGAVINQPDGTLFGAICGLDPRAHTNDPRMANAEPLLIMLSRLLTTVLAADRTQDHTSYALLSEQLAAETDPLTGLPNRLAWQRLIKQAHTRYEQSADPTVVAMLDLDNLKIVNDTRGHDAGDAYLRAAAAVVRNTLRDSDTIARLGGDEFGLLMPNCTEAAAQAVIARIYTALDTAGVSASIGHAPITSTHGFSAALAQADTAMYATKQRRRQSSSQPG